MPQFLRSVLLAGALLLVVPTIASAAVQAGQPFPTNLDTTIDLTQLTGLRGALTKPDCRPDLTLGQTHDPGAKLYRAALLDALPLSGLPPSRIVDASLFTTQSITSLLEKVRRQIDASTPAPATFAIGTAGQSAVFPF